MIFRVHCLARVLSARPGLGLLWLLAATGQVSVAHASESTEPPPLTYGHWGGAGLLQTPTARFGEAGEFNVTLSRTDPYTRITVMAQPFDWMEVGFRYIDLANQEFVASSTGQSLKDKSIDARFRLAEETDWRPALALGFRDLGGTGLFAGEYLVASKQWGALDVSLGLGWGYLGARSDFNSPLGWLSDRFDDRGANSGQSGGEFNTGTYFRGPAAVFGGVAWRLSSLPLTLKLELDGNDYQSEPGPEMLPQRSPINAGVSWRVTPSVEVSAGFERGQEASFSVTYHTSLARLPSQPKLLDAAPLPVAAPEQRTPVTGDTDWAAVSAQLAEQAGVRVQRIVDDGATLRVEVDGVSDFQPARVIGRSARVLDALSEDRFTFFTLGVMNKDARVVDYDIHRSRFVAAATTPSTAAEQLAVVDAVEPPRGDDTGAPVHQQAQNRFDGGFGLGYQQTLGGPDAFILYQLNAEFGGEFKLASGTWLAGAVNYRLLDNYDDFVYDGPSLLPRVRTQVREYLTTNAFTIPNLQLTGLADLGDDWFALGYGGLLESMFAGVGGELLYRPLGAAYAVGIDVNAVQQREVTQDFQLQDYRTLTGHVSLYLRPLPGVLATVQAGRYLAGDVGMTFDVAREFSNGVRLGAYATFTDVSEEEFGEGSFDKGFYVQLPMDLLLPSRSKSVANLVYSPLTRDGGARLGRRYRLIDLTSDRDLTRLLAAPEALLK